MSNIVEMFVAENFFRKWLVPDSFDDAITHRDNIADREKIITEFGSDAETRRTNASALAQYINNSTVAPQTKTELNEISLFAYNLTNLVANLLLPLFDDPKQTGVIYDDLNKIKQDYQAVFEFMDNLIQQINQSCVKGLFYSELENQIISVVKDTDSAQLSEIIDSILHGYMNKPDGNEEPDEEPSYEDLEMKQVLEEADEADLSKFDEYMSQAHPNSYVHQNRAELNEAKDEYNTLP